MDWQAPHTGFTLVAYLISAAALLALTLSVIVRGRTLRKRMEERSNAGTTEET